MFDDHLLKNRALLDYKKSLFGQLAILEFFQNIGISPKLNKLLLGLLLDEIHLEIMFDDHLGKTRALLDYKKSLFGKGAILKFFQRGDPMNLVQN